MVSPGPRASFSTYHQTHSAITSAKHTTIKAKFSEMLPLVAFFCIALVDAWSPSPTCFDTRRRLLVGSIAGCLFPPFKNCNAVETIGKDENCNDKSCLGVWDGLLADCPHNINFGGGAGCTSSQDDTPGIFSEPWDYSESDSLDWEEQKMKLLPAIQLVASQRGDSLRVLIDEGRYLRVIFTDAKSGEKSVGEFYFTPNDTTVQFRVGSLQPGGPGLYVSSLKNFERCEQIRKKLRYLKVPVLRNRRRSLFFVESDLDTFGPGSAALGPPAELRTGELEGRQDVDPRRKTDVLQLFPYGVNK